MLRGARFTPAGSFPSLYLAGDPVTALTEVAAVILTPHGPVTLRSYPWVFLPIDGVLTGILDLTKSDVQKELGTSSSELTGEWSFTQSLCEVPPTQSLGREAYECGSILGLRYTSTTNLASGYNLVVFTDRLPSFPGSYLEVIDPYGNLRQRLP